MNGVKMSDVSAAKPDGPYHHGDLRNALVEAATMLAREGGPDSVVLRAAARRVGVSPASAYHHFASHGQLIQAVKQQSLVLLAGRMQSALDEDQASPARDGSSGTRPGPADAARRRLRALAGAYLRFAFEEPGLFRLTFGPRGPWPADDPARPHDDSADPFRLLRQVLDELAAAGALPAERRPGLEYVTWAQVHGIAALCLDGPLARIGPDQRREIIEHALETIIRGL
jgi:AcrR family transcriptional regulator